MKYWIITTEFPPFHGGGISTYNLHNALLFAEKGHDVTVFVNDHQIGKKIERSTYKKINVIRFKQETEPYYDYLGYHAALSFQFAEIILKEIKSSGRPSYIETQDYHGIGYYLILKKKLGEPLLADIPLILTAHTPSFFYLRYNQYPLYNLPDFWTGEMEKWTLKAADILFSPSNYLIDNIKPELEEAYSQFHVLRYPFKQLYDIETDPSIVQKGDVVFFGKLTYQKGPLHLLKFMAELWDDGYDCNISFIGADHYFDPKQTNMQEYLISRFRKYYDEKKFRFEGKLPPDQLTKRLEKAYLTIVPSIVDNFPFAVIEAMEQGKVLLISDGGGQREMIEDGISGFVYDHLDVDSFIGKIKQALACTKEEYGNISRNARKRIRFLCDYEKVYQEKLSILQAYTENMNVRSEEIFPMVRNIEKAEYLETIPCKESRLSIVVPYFNTGNYIEETIENIYQVNYPDVEVTVVNDGSSDPDSIAKIILLQKKFGFNLVHQKNLGLAEARNTGIRNSSGEFIAFLDADDKVDKDFYARGIGILQRYKNLSFVSSWVQYFDSASGIWPSQNPEPPFLLLHNMVNAGFVCRRMDYFNFGKNDKLFEYGLEDYDANISLLKNGCRGVVIPEPLYYYRIHAQSMARGFNKVNQLYLYRLLSHKHAEFYREYNEEIFNLLLSNGPSYLYDNPTRIPDTDVLLLKKRISELEKAIDWYDRTLKYYQQLSNQQDKNVPEMAPAVTLPPFSVGDSMDKSREIQHWYNKEYEVLPLWYKRFGHIIKVFQGHRTLRSLFTNNELHK